MTTKLKTPLHLPVELAVEPAASAPFINPEFVEAFPKGIYNSQRESIVLGEKIGSGGEGTVYHIEGRADLVAKIYHHPPAPEKAEKLIALAQLGNERLLKMAAWPVDVLRDRPDGNVIGFVMKKIGQAAEVHALHSPKSRLKKFPEASWAFLLHVATNIVRAVATMHEHGFVIGDVNPKNILVTRQATVCLLDCDSFQFAAAGKTYRCEGGFPEYTPPELQGLPFADVDRTPEHDCFGLAVVIFQLLFLGRHPFSGRYLGAGEMPLERAIRELRFAYGDDAPTRHMQPPPGTLPLAAIPPELLALFRRAFLERDRPNPAEWLAALEPFSKTLKTCALHNGHHYFAELTACPWCDLEARAGVRLFNFKVGAQRQTPFLLEELWGEIAKLGQIERLPQRTNVSAAAISQEAIHYTMHRNLRFWLAIGMSILLGSFIAWVAEMPAAFWLLFFAGCLVRRIAKVDPESDPSVFQRLWHWNSPSTAEPLARKLRAAKAVTEKHLKQLEQQLWGKSNGEKEYYAQLQELQAAQRKYEALDERRKEKLKQAGAKAYAQALTEYLKRFAIEDSGLVSAAIAQWLRAKGIVTAADVVEKRIRKEGIISEEQRNRLLGWRRQLDTNFATDPMRYVTPADRIAIEQQFQADRERLEEELLTRTHTLRILKQQLDARREQMLPAWTKAKLSLAQTEKDWEEVARENRLAPVYVMLAASFLFVSVVDLSLHEGRDRARVRTRSQPSGQVVLPAEAGTVSIQADTPRGFFEEGEQLFQQKEYRAAKKQYEWAIANMDSSKWESGFVNVIYKYCLATEMLNDVPSELAYLEKWANDLDDKERAKLIIFYWMKSQDDLARKQYQILKKRQPAMSQSLQQYLRSFGFQVENASP